MLYKINVFVECGDKVCNYGPGPSRVCQHLAMGGLFGSHCRLYNTVVVKKDSGMYERCYACMQGTVSATSVDYDEVRDNGQDNC